VIILLLGKNGQIGWELQRTLPTLGQVVALGRDRLDLADAIALRRTVREVRPDIIVNAAAYTAVDRAEEEAALAMAVNGIAPGILAEEAARLKALLVHYSTDYVFDGTGTAPYREEDRPNPLNVYGRSKLAGEEAIRASGAPHLIFRTSWVYGLRGKNFLLTMLRLAREQEELRIVNDQVGTPNWCGMAAEVTTMVLREYRAREDSSLAGTYHLSAEGKASWYDFARAILSADPRKEEQVCRRIIPIATAQYPTPARRPLYSVLDNRKIKSTFNLKMERWDRYLEQLLQPARE